LGQNEVKERRASRRTSFGDAGVRLLVLVAVPAMAAVWMVMPRPVRPVEPPSLVLAGEEVAEVTARDETPPEPAPESEAVRLLLRLVREQNLAEVGTGEPPGTLRRRQATVRQAVVDVVREHGAWAIDALRSAAVRELWPAMAGSVKESAEQEEIDAILGSFPRMVRRYGLWVNGHRVAPRFVVRTLFKARWNALLGLETTEGFAPVERQAYWGWLALHAGGADPALRLDALTRYAEVGGARTEEARAVLLLEAGHTAEAAAHMTRAHEAGGGLRLRNHALWLLAEAGGAVDTGGAIP
jgi:hypothetical protein